jgi:hypothetical protein
MVAENLDRAYDTHHFSELAAARRER